VGDKRDRERNTQLHQTKTNNTTNPHVHSPHITPSQKPFPLLQKINTLLQTKPKLFLCGRREGNHQNTSLPTPTKGGSKNGGSPPIFRRQDLQCYHRAGWVLGLVKFGVFFSNTCSLVGVGLGRHPLTIFVFVLPRLLVFFFLFPFVLSIPSTPIHLQPYRRFVPRSLFFSMSAEPLSFV